MNEPRDSQPGLFALLREDYETHDRDWTQSGFWAVAMHRVGSWAANWHSGAARDGARLAHAALSASAYSFLGIQLPLRTKLGRRVRIWHHGCTRILARSIGDDVHLRQNTIVGPIDPGNKNPASWPAIGNGADIGSGACIRGAVEIGAEALVGANSFVEISAPPRSTVVGVPARILPRMTKPREPVHHDTSLQGAHDQNPPGISVPALILEDFRTHGSQLGAPGFWALAIHRFGNWRMSVRPKLVRGPLTVAYRTAFQAVRQVWGIDLPYDIKLGRRVRLAHHGSIHIGARSIGDDVIIRHSATVGLVRAGHDEPKPIIGNRVEIGPRACIVGSVTIGDDAIIGANTVVPIDVPPRTVVLGVPGRFVKLARVTGSSKVVKAEPPAPAVPPSASRSTNGVSAHPAGNGPGTEP